MHVAMCVNCFSRFFFVPASQYNSRHTPGPGGYDVSAALAASSTHKSAGGAGKFTKVYRPSDPSFAHLAKGGAAEAKAGLRRASTHQPPMMLERRERRTSRIIPPPMLTIPADAEERRNSLPPPKSPTVATSPIVGRRFSVAA